MILRLDLANSDGNVRTIGEWLSKYLADELERNIFGIDGPSYEELQGVFFDDYNRWMRGEYKHLYESDKNQFKIRFGEYI